MTYQTKRGGDRNEGTNGLLETHGLIETYGLIETNGLTDMKKRPTDGHKETTD